jgi:hypothetical protein
VASTSEEVREQTKETASTAVEEGKEVTRAGQQAAASVAHEVKEEAGQVAAEVSQQARRMVHETKGQLREKADSQTRSFADSLQTFADELRALSSGNPDQASTARRYVEQASSAIGDVAGQVRERSFEGLIQDVQRFARRRPGAFLAASATVGFMAGRLFRSAVDDNAEQSAAPGGPSDQARGELAATSGELASTSGEFAATPGTIASGEPFTREQP